MNRMIKRIIAIFISCIMAVSIFSILSVSAQDDDKSFENIYNGENPQLMYNYEHATVNNGDITLHIWENMPYQVGIRLEEDLTENYKITGNLKINDVIATADDDISIWNCIRLVAGRKSDGDYNTISLYRKVGIQIVNFNAGAAVGVGDIMPIPEGIQFAAGSEMAFEIERQGSRLIFRLNGATIIDYVLSESEDLAAKEGHNIIAFQSQNFDYTISNLKVLVEKEVDTEEKETEFVDIYDKTNPQLMYSFDHATVDNGDINLQMWRDVPYQVGVQLSEALTENYKLSGNIHVNDVIATADDDISIWNCIRILAGRKSDSQYVTVSIYRKVGVQIVTFNNGALAGVGPNIPLPEGTEFVNGADMSFEIERQGSKLIFTLNGTKLIDYTLAESEDLSDGANSIIAFQSTNVDYTVSDIKVLVEKEVVVTPPAEPDNPTNPDTGDNQFTVAICMIIMVCLSTGMVYSRRKEKTNG